MPSSSSSKIQFNSVFGNPVFNILLLSRLVAVFMVPIMDCDEVFNYWDPTHYLTHGFGLQTWEYSPEYAIRSWFYAGIHALLAYFGMLLSSYRGSTAPASVFYFVRSVFGAVSAGADMFLYLQIKQHLDNCSLFCACQPSALKAKNKSTFFSLFLNTISKPSTLFLVFSLWATGFFHASVSFLPSSFAMISVTFALGYLIEYATSAELSVRAPAAFKGISAIALGGLVGWPFALALAPYWGLHVLFSSPHGGFSALFNQRHLNYVKFVVLRVLVIVVPVLLSMIAFDSYLYGRFVIVPLNIVLYNVWFADSESGPDIFGTEPWHYYIQNLLLNFNIVLPFAFLIPVLLIGYQIFGKRQQEVKPEKDKASQRKQVVFNPLWHLIIAPFFIWYAIFTAQPHKEERFMYVVYSSLCLNASLAASIVCIGIPCLVGKFFKFIPKSFVKIVLPITIMSVFVALSLSRSLSLFAYYSAPTKVFTHISQFNETNTGIPDSQQYNICIGREWYRFPSSYFLPNNARLQFIPSGFDGLLPGQFLESSAEVNAQAEAGLQAKVQKVLDKYQGIWTPPKGMNNKNRADPGKLVSLDECEFVVDSAFKVDTTAGEVDFHKESEKDDLEHGGKEYEKLYCAEMIDTGASKGLARLLYLPEFLKKLTKSEIKWVEFCVYKHNKPTQV